MTSIEARFTTHDLGPGQVHACEAIRRLGYEIANVLHHHCPESDELGKAIDCIDEAVMWANASIARKGK